MRGAVLRALMQLRSAEPAGDDVSLGEIFAPGSLRAIPPAVQRARLLASAEHRLADERGHPFDRYFGRDLASRLTGANVLDLGCFTGGRSAAWIERYRLGSLVGIDINPHFLIGARLFAAERKLRANFAAAVGEALPFADRTFDAILSFDVLEHVQDPARVLVECHRVLRPGGQIYVVFPSYWHPTEHHLSLVTRTPCLHWFFSGQELVGAYDAIVRERGERAAWYRRARPELATWERGHTLNGLTRARFTQLARRAGFEAVAMPLRPLGAVGRAVERRPALRVLAPLFGALARLPGVRELVIHRVVAILERPPAPDGPGVSPPVPGEHQVSLAQ